MSITETTREKSYGKIRKNVGKRHLLILKILGERQMTAMELAKAMYDLGNIPRCERNFAAPRLTELQTLGLVKVVGKRKDEATSRNVALWAKV